MSAAMPFVAQLAILAYALVGGVLLAFSDFIMRSLAKTSGSGGVEAMQSINREVFRWIFMTLFIGLAPISLLFVAYGLFWAPGTEGLPLAGAGALYFFGCFVLTVVGNVPMNTALGRLDPASSEAQTYWRETYLPRWTALNSLRTAACYAAAATLLFGLP